METNQDIEDSAALLQKDHYNVEELAELLQMDPFPIRVAARTGALGSFIVNQHILTIRRDAVIRWLRDRNEAGA